MLSSHNTPQNDTFRSKESELFTSYIYKPYLEKMTTEQFPGSSCNYKIRINLDEDDFNAHNNFITQTIKTLISEHPKTVVHFKHLRHSFNNDSEHPSDIFLQYKILDLLRARLASRDDDQLYKAFTKQINLEVKKISCPNRFGKVRDILVSNATDKELATLQAETLNTHEFNKKRYSNAAQYTLYISRNYDLQKLKTFLIALECNLNAKNLKPGTADRTDLPLQHFRFISLRQEHLLADEKKYIPPNQSDADFDALKKELTESIIFTTLNTTDPTKESAAKTSAQLEQSRTSASCSLFASNEKIVEKRKREDDAHEEKISTSISASPQNS